jgi:uncharacterized Zn finger protein
MNRPLFSCLKNRLEETEAIMGASSGDILKDILDRNALRRMAGTRSFQRGEDYFVRERVHGLVEHAGIITAGVVGTREYDIKLWPEEGNLEYSCTCPMGTDGVFCKHCVAVGLTWLAQSSGCRPAPPKSTKPAVTMDDVRTYLAGQDKEALVDLLMERATDDHHLRQRLRLMAAKKEPGGLDLAAYRQAIDEAVDPGDFVRYDEMHDYIRGVYDTINSIAELLGEGYAVEVIGLAEHALAAVEKAMNAVDDSDGLMGDTLVRLEELHLRACQKAKPDPEELARRLFEWELRTDWDTFSGGAKTYAGVLGKKGLTVYRRLAEAQWARVPELKPGQDDLERFGKRFRITRIMETLTCLNGDIEAIVAVKKRNLSSAYAFLQIAEAYQQARKYDLALEWAERGLRAFPHQTDWRLREFLAAEYHRRKRHDEAMALIWDTFTEQPALAQYQNLKSHADRIGQWSAWRGKALAAIRERIAEAKGPSQRTRWPLLIRGDHTELVRILLWEKDISAAWHQAQEGGCSDDLWLKLAAKREKDHPEDALAVYQKLIEPTLAQTNNEAYRTAVGFLRKIRELMSRLGRSDEFAPYLASIRAEYKRKRNFIKMLNHARWA